MHTFLLSIARGWALTLGGFILLNLLGQQLRSGFDANLWWIDLRAMPRAAGDLLLLGAAITLFAFALRPVMSRRRKVASITAVAIILCVTLANAVTFWRLLARGDIITAWPVPLSLLIAIVLACILVALLNAPTRRTDRRAPRHPWRHHLVMLSSIAFTCAAFPFLQMLCFGSTDYARRADVAIVLGARAYADGTASAPLEDRVRTACDLYKNGQVRWLLMTGGPGDGDIHETEAMQRLAVQLGVPPDRILRDPHGVSTQASAEYTTKLLEHHGFDRVLVVSHGYHLPRVKLAYQRQGVEVYTVPARERHRLRAKPVYVAREIAAMWWYYLSPLWS